MHHKMIYTNPKENKENQNLYVLKCIALKRKSLKIVNPIETQEGIEILEFFLKGNSSIKGATRQPLFDKF